jgi:hypothetical protein
MKNLYSILLLGVFLLFGGCNQTDDSTSNFISQSKIDKNNSDPQGIRKIKVMDPENDGPGGGDCTETWITSATETWCSIEYDDNDDCCCIRVATTGYSVNVTYKFDISEAVYTEAYYVMDWYSDSSSDEEHWSDVMGTYGSSTTNGCEGGVGYGLLTDLLYPLCPGEVHLTVGIRYKTSLNGPFCYCNIVYTEFDWIGFYTCQ